MAGWRDIKSKMKAGVHSTFAFPAVYLTHQGGTPVPCFVRVHRKQMVVDGGADGGELLDIAERVIFDLSEVPTVLPKAFLFLSASEVYKTAVADPRRDGYLPVEVAPVAGAELQNLVAGIDFTTPAWAKIAGLEA